MRPGPFLSISFCLALSLDCHTHSFCPHLLYSHFVYSHLSPLCTPPLLLLPRQRENALLLQMALLGGYRVGEKVYYKWASQTLSDGDRVEYGKQGEVTGPATGEEVGTHINVLFPGNKRNVECLLSKLSRTAPSVRPSTAIVKLYLEFTPPSSSLPVDPLDLRLRPVHLCIYKTGAPVYL